MDKTLRKIKLFATYEVNGEQFADLLGEFATMDDIKIRPADFAKDVQLEFEEYFIGEEE